MNRPNEPKPPPWAYVAGFVITLLFYAAILSGAVLVGNLVDAFLNEQLGPIESDLTGYAVLLVLALYNYDRYWAQPRRERKT